VRGLVRLRFGRAGFFFNGAAVVVVAGLTLVPETLPGSMAVVLLSSMVGLGEATTCCSCGGCAFVFCGGVGTGLVASVTGSVSPFAVSHAAQPPSSARALYPFSPSICAARALVCSLGQEQ
jgi:hypothetical protein